MIRILPLVCCLAACSGGGAGNPVPGDAFATLQDGVTVHGITPFATLPETGDVAYEGRVRLNLPLGGATPAVFEGDLDLRVSFGITPDPVTGRIGNLHGAGGAVTGSLQIGEGVLYPAARERDYQFTAGLSGTLTQNALPHSITAEMSGDFYGPAGAGVAGVIARGAVRQGDEIDIFDGSFAAARAPSGR
ncbi:MULTISPECIES: hypothetical protein [unclassified Yoonia]|uniref:hypothetical protein n=1 Tax=unclassified Yoonia TaxID=2629118 RepID=UPI002AFFCB0F|nr:MULTISPECIES: hypothetical protein [unclassified Yoonia]